MTLYTEYIINKTIHSFFKILCGILLFLVFTQISVFSNVIFNATDIGMAIHILLFVLLPTLMKVAMPISALMASFLQYHQFAQQGTLDFLLSVGLSPWRIIKPMFIVGIILMFSSFFLNFYTEPISVSNFITFKNIEFEKKILVFMHSISKTKQFITTNNFTIYFDHKTSRKHTTEPYVFDGVIFAHGVKNSAHDTSVIPPYYFTGQQGGFTLHNDSQKPALFIKNGNGYIGHNEPTQENPNKYMHWDTLRFNNITLYLNALIHNQAVKESNKDAVRKLSITDYWKYFANNLHTTWWQDDDISKNEIYGLEKIFFCLACLFLPIWGSLLAFQHNRFFSSKVFFYVLLCLSLPYAWLSLGAKLLIYTSGNLYIYTLFMLSIFIMTTSILFWSAYYIPLGSSWIDIWKFQKNKQQ
jgi:lipopolysaccharide export LptBFGC system permease protein LptF